jgi:hypothetical protein
MGERPCGADATVFGFIASLLTPVFASKVSSATERHRNLTDYRDRILGQYFRSYTVAGKIGELGQTKNCFRC